MDDDRLMGLIAQGEEEAFRLLVLRWQRQVLSFLIHMLGTVEEAEDLAQDTFVQVFRKAPEYRADGTFRSWLFRIAGNRARSALRRRKVLSWVGLERAVWQVASGDPDPLANLEREQEAAALRGAVARLPARQREALVLHRFQGLRYKEVAAAMETTVPGVESLLQRALAGLRQQLTGTATAGKGDR